MRCPKCSDARSRVSETKFYKERVRRRRECKACGHRYSTDERKVGDRVKTINEIKDELEQEEPSTLQKQPLPTMEDIVKSLITQEVEKSRGAQ